MANVAIRFSVENAETVRQALAALGKDGEKALKQLQTGTAAPNQGLNALSSLINDAKSRMMGLATSIGPAGNAMVQLGPAGMAAAAAIGLVSGAFSAATERAAQFAAWARQVREQAETTGVTTDALQALAQAGDRVGLSFEQSSSFLTRMTTSVAQLRQGTGPLFEALARIDDGLVREVASARSTAEALDVLRRAYQGLSDTAQRNALARAIGGEGGVGAARLLAGMGSTAEEINRARQAGRLASAEQLRAADEMQRHLVRTQEEASKIWANLWSGPALAAQQAWADTWLSVARYAERIASASERVSTDDLSGATTATGAPVRRGTGLPRPPLVVPPLGSEFGLTPGTAPAPSTAATELGLMRQRNQILGDAITLAEQRALREMELRAVTEDASLSEAERARRLQLATRGMTAFDAVLAATIASTRQRLALVTEEQLTTAKLAELEQLRAKGFIRNAEEMAAAERLARREIRETLEAQRVRASETPALTRLAIDADNLTKNLDQNLAGALRGTTSSILDMAKGTKTLSQGFGELAERIAGAVAEAILMKTVVGPMANSISGLFGFGGGGTQPMQSALGNVFSGGSIVPFARGGVVHRPTVFRMANGGLASMSENEAEAIMPLRRLSSGRLGVEFAGGGGNMYVQIINNTSSRITKREESDGRGGRRVQVQIDEMVAGALGRQGSQSRRALIGSGAMTRL